MFFLVLPFSDDITRAHALSWLDLLTLHQGKRLFIKDMIYYLVPPNGKPASIAPSLARKERGVGTNGISSELQSANGVSSPNDAGGEPNNPTVVPEDILKQFHFTFLIRHPRSSIPSYYRCTIPPLDEVTGFYNFMPSEAGYDELRRVFDYLRSVGQVGPNVAGHNNSTNGHGETNGHATKVDICVIDADDLLDNPNGIIEAYCKSVGLDYDPSMLNWDTEADHQKAKDAFAKWHGFHEDAINSSSLRPRLHVSLAFVRQIIFAHLTRMGIMEVECTELTSMTARRKRSKVARTRTPNGSKSMARRGQRSSERRSMRMSRTTST